MKTDEQIRAHVMRRVHTIYWSRQLARPAPRVALLAVLSAGLVSSVSIANIAVNVLSVRGFSQLAFFALTAFTSTTPLVQALFVGIVASVAWFSFDGLKRVQTVILPHKAETATAQ